MATTYQLSGMHCGACVAKVTKALQPLASSVNVSLNPQQVSLDGSSAGLTLNQLQAALSAIGKYEISEVKAAQPVPAVVTELTWFQTYQPLLLIVAFILGASLLVQLGQHAGHGMGMTAITLDLTMRYFMAGFFLVFSFFKLLDVKAFATAYQSYDLLAAKWPTWGRIYPFVELGLGMAYLANFMPTVTNWVTLIVMGFSAIGVIRAVMQKSKIQCACLGTVFKLPMSTVTIVEDVGMVVMAAAMLFLPMGPMH
jgi:copper chaperone CopZ